MSCEIVDIQSDITSEHSIVRIRLKIGGNLHEVFFKSSDIRLTANAETILAFSMLPCLATHSNMKLNREISRKLLNSTGKIMDIYCAWHPSFQRIEIEDAIPVKKDISTENRVGVFFSGGVDSFYTLLKNRDEITDLILVHGFDFRLDQVELRKQASQMVRNVGAQCGKNVIEIETNIREFLDHFVSWASLGHGPALASIGHLFAPFFKKIFISANYSYAHLNPWGTHILLDPLWSSNSLKFVHYGVKSRVEKVRFISGFDQAMQSLKVCSVKKRSDYNCCECTKCLRTMINLHVVGALHKCKTFNGELDLRKISRKFILLGGSDREFIDQIMRALEDKHGSSELYKVMQRVLNRPRWKSWLIFAWDNPLYFLKTLFNVSV